MIECVPNVSEGRDPAIIERIAESITSCRLLDVHSDPDHHRSVFTMIGDEEQVADGAVALVASAIALIDLREHRGVHPRMGAVDVIPFVPLECATMSSCVEVARRVGRMIADQWRLPVYLYGAAAQCPLRLTLPRIRRGGFERLTDKLGEHTPDFGPSHPHPTAGAIAVGARHPLVAFNVVLNTSDVSVARRIAAIVRQANGGLPGVMALGLSLDTRHLTQVSMNLTDVSATTVPDAFEAVGREAARVGVPVLESEIVGLVPRLALGGATAEDLLMQDDPRARILEDRIAEPTT